LPENSTNKLAVNQYRYSTPVENSTGDLIATPGLYLEGFFVDGQDTSLNSINLNGGNLGYNSYVILQRMFDKYSNSGDAKITMTDVNWCPYTKLTEGNTYNPNAKYYKDNGHYGFVTYDLMQAIKSGETYDIERQYYTKNADDVYVLYSNGLSGFNAAIAAGLYGYDEKQFNADILSELVYIDEEHGGRNEDGTFSDIITGINDASLQMLRALSAESSKFKNFVG
jgi:hypothetical protein